MPNRSRSSANSSSGRRGSQLLIAAALVVSGFAGLSVARAATAPTCVQVQNTSSGTTYRVKVTNTCGSTQRVKVIWAYGPDSACTTLNSGYQFTHTTCSGWACSVPPRPRFDRLESC